MPRQYSEREFVEYLRGNFDQPEGVSDKSIVERWMATHPEDRGILKGQTQDHPDARKGGLLTTAAITGARVLPGMIGAGVGGILGAVGSPVGSVAGAMIGGGVMGGVGESIAQWLEKETGRRTEYNPWAMGVEAGMSAIPITKIRGISRAAKVAGEAAKGGLMGGGGTAALQWAEGREANPAEIAVGTALGGLIGGGSAGLITRVPKEFRASSYSSSKHQQLMQERLGQAQRENTVNYTTPGGVDLTDPVSTRIRQRVQNAKAPAWSLAERLAKNDITGAAKTRVDAAHELSDIQTGGMGQRWLDSETDFRFLQDEMEVDDVLADVTYYADLKGMKFGSAKLTKDVEAAYAKAYTSKNVDDMEAAEKLFLRLHGTRPGRTDTPLPGEALPAGYTPTGVLKELETFKNRYMADGKDWGKIEAYGKRIFDFNRDTLDTLQEAGFVTPTLYKELISRADDGNYVPLTRFVEMMSEGRLTGITSKNPIQELLGSPRTTLDPLTASLLRRRDALMAASHNQQKNTFLNLREINEEFSEAIPIVRDGEDLLPGYEAIKSWKDGAEVLHQVPKGVAVALDNLDANATNIMGEIGVGFLTRLAQRMATSLNLGFSITNVPRDVSDVFLLGKVVENPRQIAAFAYDWASAAAQLGLRELKDGLRPVFKTNAMQGILGADRTKALLQPYNPSFRKLAGQEKAVTRQDWVQEGAAYGGLQRTHLDPQRGIPGEYLERGMKDKLGDAVLGGVDTILAPIGRLSNVLEESTKLASFNALTRRGITGQERAIRTRRYGGSPDFAVRGSWAKGAGNAVLFFNAQMQGISRNIEAVSNLLSGKDLKTKKGRRAMMGVMMPITGLELWRQKHNAQFVDPDGVLSQDRISDTDQQNYHVFITDELETIDGVTQHKKIKLSKGHLARVLFNPIQDVFRAAFSEERAFKPTQTVLDMTEQFLPGSMKLDTVDTGTKFVDGMVSSLAPLWRTPVELLANRNFFYGTAIEPMSQERLDPSQRARATTSTALSGATKAIAAGTGVEVSPLKVQHAVEQFLPGGGRQLLELADRIVAGETGPSALGGAFIAPVARRFRGSEFDQRKSDQFAKFYRAHDRSQKAKATLRELRVNNPSGVQAYINRNARALQRANQLDAYARRFSALRRRASDDVRGPIENALLNNIMSVIDRK